MKAFTALTASFNFVIQGLNSIGLRASSRFVGPDVAIEVSLYAGVLHLVCIYILLWE